MENNLKNPEAVTQYLLIELMKRGYRLECNRSTKSKDSWYIKIYAGTWGRPRDLHLRISDHGIPSKYQATVKYDFDICGSHWRKDAVNCTDFLSRLTPLAAGRR